MGRQKYHFIVPAWGDEYIDIFLKMSLPTQLSCGNLTQLTRTHRDALSYRIYTRRADVSKIESSPIFAYLRQLMDAEVVPADNVNFGAAHHYEPFSECYKIGMKEAERHNAACIFLTADQIWADGSFCNVVKIGDAGNRAVMVAGPRVTQESFMPFFLSNYSYNEDFGIRISPSEAVSISMEHLHPWDQSLFWSDENEGRAASFMFWRVGDEGVIMRCFHLHPIMVNPENGYYDFFPTIDGSDFVKRVCPHTEKIYVVQNSDEAMFFSVAPASQSAELINRPRNDWHEVAKWAVSVGISRHNLFYLQKSIRLHKSEMSDCWNSVESLADSFTGKLIEYLGNPPRLFFLKLMMSMRLRLASFLRCHMPFLYNYLKKLRDML